MAVRSAALGSLLVAVALAAPAHADTLSVGAGKAYAKPCAAVAAAHDGDVIEIDAAGNYDGDVCAIDKNGLTLRGVGGRAKIDAQGKSFGGKAIWVITGHDTTVENVELSGATVADKNGAGIRQEGANLTVRGSYFHDNDDGILSDAGADSQILIEYSEFANNGFGDGYSHNMYIGNVARFTLRYCYSHDAKVGHLVKSRAAENYILYNRISGETGSSSYELDLPNAGTSFVIGNSIEQGSATENPNILAYGEEGTAAGNPGHALYVVNNTFVNDHVSGGTFINVGSAIDTPALLENNIFSGPGTVSNQASAVLTANFSAGDALLVDPSHFDYHLQPGSPCIDHGQAPGSAAGMALAPVSEYVHPVSMQSRVGVGTIDIGAYEFGTGNDAGSGGAGGVSGVLSSAGMSGAQAGSNAVLGGSSGVSAAGAAPSSAANSGGCSCRAVPSSRVSSLWLLPLFGALLSRARARAKQRLSAQR